MTERLDDTAQERAEDPGGYIGHEPERAADTIPGGVRPDDERISAVGSQSTGVGRPERRGEQAEQPGGHRQGDRVSDDDIREAGDTQ